MIKYTIAGSLVDLKQYVDYFKCKDAKLEIQKRFFSRFGTLVWNSIAPALRDKTKIVYRKTIRNSMFNLLSATDDYVEINKIIHFLKSLA